VFARVLFVLAVAAVGVFLVAYVITRNRRYLSIAWQIVMVGLVAGIIVFALAIVERFVLV
jgi:hypothetical protein